MATLHDFEAFNPTNEHGATSDYASDMCAAIAAVLADMQALRDGTHPQYLVAKAQFETGERARSVLHPLGSIAMA